MTTTHPKIKTTSKESTNQYNKTTFTTAALSALMALSSGVLSSCSNAHVVDCQHINPKNPTQSAVMHKGMCMKIGGSHIQPATASDLKKYKPYDYNSYIKCYGIAASGKNDCGTKNSACAGTSKTARTQDAWIAFPRDLCVQAGGKVVEPQKK